MKQSEIRQRLIQTLLKEQPRYCDIAMPEEKEEQEQLLRGLMNVRLPSPISPEFQKAQDEYLRERNRERGIIRLSELTPIRSGVYLWRGDITRLAVGAIVNAANSGMTGCYRPCHTCIDNCIHTYAGIQLRLACDDIMKKQGYEEPTGSAKLTPGFNLPCDYVIHTVGPIVDGALTEEHERQLASCYLSCLELADRSGIDSVAFCSISTGVFRFPKQRAAEIAALTVSSYLKNTGSRIRVIFSVFSDSTYDIYKSILSQPELFT